MCGGALGVRLIKTEMLGPWDGRGVGLAGLGGRHCAGHSCRIWHPTTSACVIPACRALLLPTALRSVRRKIGTRVPGRGSRDAFLARDELPWVGCPVPVRTNESRLCSDDTTGLAAQRSYPTLSPVAPPHAVSMRNCPSRSTISNVRPALGDMRQLGLLSSQCPCRRP